jgi:osmotically-inducible protein OsmY
MMAYERLTDVRPRYGDRDEEFDYRRDPRREGRRGRHGDRGGFEDPWGDRYRGEYNDLPLPYHGSRYGYALGLYPYNGPYPYDDRPYEALADRYRHGRRDHDTGRRRDRGYEERDLWDRATDEIASWFGDEDAERRRRSDQHRGKGPKGYVRSDERIKEDVSDRLADDGMLDASDIEVSVKDREVTLAGHVSNRADKRRAEDCADAVSGVLHVQNNLRVRSPEGRAEEKQGLVD